VQPDASVFRSVHPAVSWEPPGYWPDRSSRVSAKPNSRSQSATSQAGCAVVAARYCSGSDCPLANPTVAPADGFAQHPVDKPCQIGWMSGFGYSHCFIDCGMIGNHGQKENLVESEAQGECEWWVRSCRDLMLINGRYASPAAPAIWTTP